MASHAASDMLWRAKLAARLHDPAEKALVLFRDPAGHARGSIVSVGKEVGFAVRTVCRSYKDGSTVEFEELDLGGELEQVIEQADHWAAAADRAQFPKDDNDRFQRWAQVRFAEEGEIVHPLSGERYAVRNIGQDVLAAHIKKVSEEFLKGLVHRGADGHVDARVTGLAFWRFGSELGAELEGIGPLWGLLPADTRTPDHTIWQHLDLCSALAGALVAGGKPALLTVSMGPVQGFIASGRSTSDLWAGSHFLSTVAWQAMRVVAEELGPDAILFPALRGVPIVDLWLIEQGVRRELFERADWNDKGTDYSPLFAAALPNKFVAVVPEGAAGELAEKVERSVRQWVARRAEEMLARVLKEIGEQPGGQHCYHQLRTQLEGFPEVHWSVAPWLDQGAAERALAPFYPGEGCRPGLFGTDAWRILASPVEPEAGWRFWAPNDGVLYPAVHDAGERLLAAAKAVRGFGQLTQRGYRDSLTGEHEWLALEEADLTKGSPRRRTDTLWARLAQKRPSWVKPGEHLSAFGLIKRLWPTEFVNWVKGCGVTAHVWRYVVSTHVMALAPTIERLLKDGPAWERELNEAKRREARRAYAEVERRAQGLERPALPRKLVTPPYRERPWWETASRLPAMVDEARERAEQAEEEEVVEKVLAQIEKAVGVPVERYYGLLLMDGDRLGSWLSGDQTLEFGQSFHSRVGAYLSGLHDERLKAFLKCRRPSSPARHASISLALNGFALDLVRHVVEDVFLGKVLYAGGDDVMAMTAACDLLPASQMLRAVYRGSWSEPDRLPAKAGLDLAGGFVRWRNRLYMVMGKEATTSCGAVFAHHQAPLAMVLRELRAAERRAKTEGGRDAFSLSVIKRSGGTLALTAKWGEPLRLLAALRKFLADPGVSRRAVYQCSEWLADVPMDDQEMLAHLVAYEFDRHAQPEAKERHDIRGLACRLAALAFDEEFAAPGPAQPARRAVKLANFLSVAEFLAREVRGEPSA